MKRTAAITVAVTALLFLCASCVRSGTNSPSGDQTRHAGTYTLFALDYFGDMVAADTFDMEAELVLGEDGKGSMTVNGETADFSGWSANGNAISIVSGRDTLTAEVNGGILILDLEDGIMCYYASEGADTSGISYMTRDEYIEKAANDRIAMQNG